MVASTKKINNLITYENPVLYVNSVVLAVFHIFAFIIFFLIMEKCISCTQETDIS